MPNKVLQYYCEVVKEEPLNTLEPEYTAGNTCVLESASPFFGYYHDAPMGKPEPYIYYVLERYYTLIETLNAAASINSKRIRPVDLVPGVLSVPGRICPVMRLKGIGHYNQATIVQENLIQEGVLFSKKKRTVKERMGVIRLSKMLSIKEARPGIFLDHEDNTKGYFEVPGRYSWEEFKELTGEAKYDTSILYFDAAQAFIVTEAAIVNLVRIYRENLNPDHLEAIKRRYMQLIR